MIGRRTAAALLSAVLLLATGEAAAQPAIAINPGGPVDFGTPPIGKVVTAPTQLFNVGDRNLLITAITSPMAPFSTRLPQGVALPYTLTPGAALPLALLFSPVAAGMWSDEVTIESNAGNAPRFMVRVLGASGAPKRVITSTGLPFPPQKVGTTSMPAHVTIENQGMGDLEGNSLVLDGMDKLDFAVNAPIGPFTVHPGGKQVFDVIFQPSKNGARTARLVVLSADPNIPIGIVALDGKGTGAMWRFDPVGIDFGMIRLGQTLGPVAGAVTNDGDLDGDVLAVTLDPQADAAFSLAPLPRLPSTLMPGMQLPFALLAQAAVVGRKQATLRVTVGTPQGPFDYVTTVRATGVTSNVTVSPASFDFGACALGVTATELSLTVGNAEVGLFDDTLNVSRAEIVPASAVFTVAPLRFPVAVTSGESTTIAVRFTPTEARDYQAVLELHSDDGRRPVVTVPLLGRGHPLSASPARITFPATPLAASSLPEAVTIENHGQAPLPLRLAAEGESPDGFIVDHAAAFTLASGAREVLPLRFAPARTSRYEAELVVRTDGFPDVRIPLAGNPTTPLFSAAPLVVDFGPVTRGNVAGPVEVVLRNVGLDEVALQPIASSDPAFTLDARAVPAVLPPRGEARMHVTFRPTANVAYRGEIRLGVLGRPTAQLTVRLVGRGDEPTLIADSGCAVGGRGSGAPLVLLAVLGLCALALRLQSRAR